MINVTIKVKDNNLYGEVIWFNADFSGSVKLIEVKKWVERMVGDNELLNIEVTLGD